MHFRESFAVRTVRTLSNGKPLAWARWIIASPKAGLVAKVRSGGRPTSRRRAAYARVNQHSGKNNSPSTRAHVPVAGCRYAKQVAT